MSGMDETNLLFMLGGIAALFAVTFFFFVRSLLENRERRLAARLSEGNDDPADRLELATDQPMKPLGDFLSHTGLDIDAEQAVGWMTFVSVVVACVLFWIRPEWWIGLIGMALGVAAVWAILLVYRFRYRLKLQDQLPDTIFLMSRSLRAGLSLEQTLMLVGNQGVEPLASEFRKANNQMQFGLTIPLALEMMSKRLRVSDFNNLVSTISLYSVTGGNLPLLLDRLGAATRDQNQFRAFFRSATALGRLSSFFIAGAGPLFFLAYALMDPEYAEFFFTNQVGILALCLSAFLEVVGLFWLWSIIRLDY
jgi:Flp pilus assembly protein TadB